MRRDNERQALTYSIRKVLLEAIGQDHWDARESYPFQAIYA